MNVDEGYPQFIRVNQEVKDLYLDPLIKDPNSQFFKRELTEVYFLAAAVGFKNKRKVKDSKLTDVRLYRTIDNKNKILIRVIALSESNFNYKLLENGKEVLSLIREYANGGAQLLHSKIFSSPNHNFSMEDEVWELLKQEKEFIK